MGDYIYILIGIIWVIYSLYSASQKAAQKKQNSGLPPSGPSQSSPLPIPGNQGGGKSLLEDIFRELSGESKPIQQAEKPAPIQTVVQPVQVKHVAKPVKSSAQYDRISGYAANYTQKEVQSDRISGANEEQPYKNESYTKKFDLREAVIFSELLNRKYF
jgi:hypothetical protein